MRYAQCKPGVNSIGSVCAAGKQNLSWIFIQKQVRVSYVNVLHVSTRNVILQLAEPVNDVRKLRIRARCPG